VTKKKIHVLLVFESTGKLVVLRTIRRFIALPGSTFLNRQSILGAESISDQPITQLIETKTATLECEGM